MSAWEMICRGTEMIFGLGVAIIMITLILGLPIVLIKSVVGDIRKEMGTNKTFWQALKSCLNNSSSNAGYNQYSNEVNRDRFGNTICKSYNYQTDSIFYNLLGNINYRR